MADTNTDSHDMLPANSVKASWSGAEVDRREDASDIAADLLDFLKKYFADLAISYTVQPRKLLGGSDSKASNYLFQLTGVPDEYAGKLVLRVFRPSRPAPLVQREALYQNHLAALDFPSPEVLVADPSARITRRPFLIMKWLPGRDMLSLLRSFPPSGLKLPHEMARLHATLHALPEAELRCELESRGLAIGTLTVELQALERELEKHPTDWFRSGFSWLTENRPQLGSGLCICHGDFHPGNILVQDRRPTAVLDWSYATIDEVEWDVAKTYALLMAGPIKDFTWPVSRMMASGRRWWANKYLAEYGKLRPIRPKSFHYYLALHSYRVVLARTQRLGHTGNRRSTGSTRAAGRLSERVIADMKSLFERTTRI